MDNLLQKYALRPSIGKESGGGGDGVTAGISVGNCFGSGDERYGSGLQKYGAGGVALRIRTTQRTARKLYRLEDTETTGNRV